MRYHTASEPVAQNLPLFAAYRIHKHASPQIRQNQHPNIDLFPVDNRRLPLRDYFFNAHSFLKDGDKRDPEFCKYDLHLLDGHHVLQINKLISERRDDARRVQAANY